MALPNTYRVRIEVRPGAFLTRIVHARDPKHARERVRLEAGERIAAVYKQRA